MPRRQPFTLLCQAAAKIARPGRFDLHAHSTASDGDSTPSQLIGLARNEGLDGIALTDHDSTNGLAEALETAASLKIEVVPGVEISTHHAGRDYHVLGLFVDTNAQPLQHSLAAIRFNRRDRFQKYLEAFSAEGIRIPDHLLAGLSGDIALGRRHLAKLLVAAGHANTVQIAFLKYIIPQRIPSFHNVPIGEALTWIHAAGGIASLAHPPSEFTLDQLCEMRKLGLDAVEVNCPSVGYEFGQDVATWCRSLGMTVTAGSDYHGPGGVPLGSRTLSRDQFDDLRRAAGSNRD